MLYWPPFDTSYNEANLIRKLFQRKAKVEAAPPTKNSAAKTPAKKDIKGGHAQGTKRASHARKKTSPQNAPLKWDISQFRVPEIEGKTLFHSFDLPVELMHGIADLGFQYCSPIQAQSLPHTLTGHDLIGKAQTGTGKTAAFLINIINDLLNNPLEGERFGHEPRALIIAPTRELVMQIAEDSESLNKYTGLKTHALVGGMDYGKQQQRLRHEIVDILVATPGRLLDFCGNQDIYLDQIEIMVIDEADRMLDMGFIPQVRRIIRQTPQKIHRQTLLFSATFTPEVLSLSDQWTIDPIRVEIEPDSIATDTVTQHVYLCASDEKYKLLYNLLLQSDVDNVIIFANRRDQCRHLHEKLLRHGFKAGLLSGEIAQNKRVKTLEGFKSDQLNVLVATDVAGRGIHIDGVSHVVNYTLPEEPEDYVHRIGRTGRAGKSGTSISFACEEDAFQLMPIGTLLGKKIECEHPPQHLLVDTPPLGKAIRSESRQPIKSRNKSRTGDSRRRPSSR